MNVHRFLSSVAVLAALALFWSPTASASECDCQGGGTVLELQFQYTGPGSPAIWVEQPARYQSGKSSAKSGKSGKSRYTETVWPEITFNEETGFYTFMVFGKLRYNRRGRKITIFVNGSPTTIYTNCSQDIAEGMEFGPFIVTSGMSRYGGAFCELDESLAITLTSFNPHWGNGQPLSNGIPAEFLIEKECLNEGGAIANLCFVQVDAVPLTPGFQGIPVCTTGLQTDPNCWNYPDTLPDGTPALCVGPVGANQPFDVSFSIHRLAPVTGFYFEVVPVEAGP